MLNQENITKSESDFKQMIELLSIKKTRPISRYLYPTSYELLDLIESQKHPLEKSLKQTQDILKIVWVEFSQYSTTGYDA